MHRWGDQLQREALHHERGSLQCHRQSDRDHLHGHGGDERYDVLLCGLGSEHGGRESQLQPGECETDSSDRLLDLSHTVFPDRSSRKRHELFRERDTFQRIQRNREFQCERVAVWRDCHLHSELSFRFRIPAMAVSTLSSTPVGTYSLTIKATSGTLTHSTAVVFGVSTGSAIRVNAGGPSYLDSGGQTWSADTGFNGGNTFSTTNTISNTNDPVLYQTERFGPTTYNFTVPNGNYSVVLKFAEIYWTAVGQREFNVAINGTAVLTNFDIVAAAGGSFKAIDKTFAVTVTNGTIAIQFSTGAADYAKVSAIQVQVAAGVGVQVSPSAATLQGGQSSIFTATVTGTTNMAVTWTMSPQVGTLTATGMTAT